MKRCETCSILQRLLKYEKDHQTEIVNIGLEKETLEKAEQAGYFGALGQLSLIETILDTFYSHMSTHEENENE